VTGGDAGTLQHARDEGLNRGAPGAMPAEGVHELRVFGVRSGE